MNSITQQDNMPEQQADLQRHSRRKTRLFVLVALSGLVLLGVAVYAFLRLSPRVNIQSSATGLSSLKFKGQEMLSDGDFHLNQLTMSDGTKSFGGSLVPSKVARDGSGTKVTHTYNWGAIDVQYLASGNRLTLTIDAHNRSKNTIEGLWMQPLAFRFSSKVQEYDGVTPIFWHNIGAPTALTMTYASGVMVAVNEDVKKPLITGVPWALDRPASTVFPFTIDTARVGMFPDSLPVIHRPIPPGSSDQYQISFRFFPRSAKPAELTPDVFKKFSAAFPPRLNWTDRRSIGMLVLGTSATGWATNPRGWLLDPTLNINTPAGIAHFRERILAYADYSITVLQSMNAQGMITWDIEGEQFPHATTYIGDPRLFATLAPEMAGIADDYFKKFRDAGFKVGVCIRPQQLIIGEGGGNASQVPVSDPAKLMLDKIKYARDRWGATLFYVDSNGKGNTSDPMNAEVFKTVAEAYPDILLVPEHSNVEYFAYTAPYFDLRQGFGTLPPLARRLYPKAFSVINISDDTGQNHDAIVKAAKQGDTLLFRGWYNDPSANLAKVH